MKANTITFEAQSDYVFNVGEKPIPAAKLIPDWWKNIPKYSNEKNKLDLNRFATITVKQCMPTIDMFSAGYIIPLWADILVTQTEHGPYLKWTVEKDVFQVWDKSQTSNYAPPVGFNNTAFKYLHGWNILTPPSWSTLFIHPPAYEDLPIRAIAGVVDTDILNTPINCPVFIKEGFEGIIKKGTPIAQLIPFKREGWVAEYTNLGDAEMKYRNQKFFTELYGYYASRRARKSYK